MAENQNSFQDIKSGVDGILSDVPEPTEGAELPTEADLGNVEVAEELPETNYVDNQNYTQDAPAYQEAGTNYPQQTLDSERIQAIVEAVVKEKFEEMTQGVGNLAVWKDKVNNDLIGIKQEIIRTQQRFEGLQNAIAGKLGDYDQGIRNITSEMKALEKVFEKILEPLTSNIKELGRITEEMKKYKK